MNGVSKIWFGGDIEVKIRDIGYSGSIKVGYTLLPKLIEPIQPIILGTKLQ